MNTYLLAVAGEQVARLLVSGAIGALIALLAGYLLMRWLARARLDSARNEAERILGEAGSEASVLRKTAEVDAKAEFLKGEEKLRAESNEARIELKATEKRLTKREDNLEAKLDTLTTKERNVEQAQKKLTGRLEELAKREQEASALVAERRERLLQVSGMTLETAKQTVESVEDEGGIVQKAQQIELPEPFFEHP